MKKLHFASILPIILFYACSSPEVQQKNFQQIVAKYEQLNKPNASIVAGDIELLEVDTVSARSTCSLLVDQIYKRANSYLKISGASPLVDSLIEKEPKRFIDCELSDPTYVIIRYKFKLDNPDWFMVFSESDSLIYFSEFRD